MSFTNLLAFAENPDFLFHGGIGLKMTVIEKGYAEGEIPVTSQLGNPIGSIHGGAYLALADKIMGPKWATKKTFRFGASGLRGALLASMGYEAE